MKHSFRAAWSSMWRFSYRAEPRAQVAVICQRGSGASREFLLITSRNTGRWIVPKGWPITGLDGPSSALQEAWEEAGVRDAQIDAEPVGHYTYDKRLDNGASLPVLATVYLAQVEKLSETYPEVDERTREWVSPQEAARRVNEPELKAILRTI